MQADFPFLGDVRGLGLFVGVEIVRDPITKMHAPVLAKWIKDACKARHVLVSSDGPYDNVIKMKPPMVFNRQNADEVVATLRWVRATCYCCCAAAAVAVLLVGAAGGCGSASNIS